MDAEMERMPKNNRMKAVTVQQMRDLERQTNSQGHSYAAMMERAGRSVAEAIAQRRPIKGARILALIGPGNNGGDGVVCAHHLGQMGANVLVYVWRRDTEEDSNLSRQVCASERGAPTSSWTLYWAPASRGPSKGR